nr:MAG TPA: hypothetical protein [Caudoviricetes sp.]
MVRGYVFADFPFLSPLATSMRGNPLMIYFYLFTILSGKVYPS